MQRGSDTRRGYAAPSTITLMKRWSWSPRRASTVTGPATVHARRFRHWMHQAVLLGLAIGLVVMHHLVGAHAHAPTSHAGAAPHGLEQDHAATAPAGLVALPALPPDAPPDEASPNEAQLHQPPAGGAGGTAMMLHLCVAVVGAALVLAALALVASSGSARALAPVGSLRWSAPSRAPPVPRRLAQLQVLRV